MNKLAALILVALSITALAKDTDFLPKDARNALKKVHATRRELIIIDEKKYWVVDYAVGAKYSHTRTNLVEDVFGKYQTNPLEDDANATDRIRKAKKNAAKKDAKNLEKAIKNLEKARDKSSEAMRDLYDSVLAILEEPNS